MKNGSKHGHKGSSGHKKDKKDKKDKQAEGQNAGLTAVLDQPGEVQPGEAQQGQVNAPTAQQLLGGPTSPLTHEMPVAGASAGVVGMPRMDILGQADQFMQHRQSIIEGLQAEAVREQQTFEGTKQAHNSKMGQISQRLLELGAEPDFQLDESVNGHGRRGPVPGRRGPGRPRKNQTEAAAPKKTKGKRRGRRGGMNKSAAVLRLLVEQCRSPQFRRTGITSEAMQKFTSKVGLSPTETQTGLQAACRAKPPKASYTTGPGSRGRGGHYKPTKEAIAAYDAGALS